MGAGGTVRAAEVTGAARVRAVAARKPRETVFRIALAGALVVHAALIIGVTRSVPLQRGEKSGRPDGISVELVEAADLRSKNTFATDGAPPGAAAAAKPAAQDVKRPPEQQKSAAPTSPKEAPELAPPPDQAAKQDETSKEQKQDGTGKEQKQASQLWPTLEFALPTDQADKRNEPSAAPKPAPKPQPQPQPQQQPAPQLQLKLPDAPFLPSGGGASFARPAGITRSGENDEFGRGVIRALRKTMPQGGPLPGQVTVRFLLSDKGNLVEVRLAASSGDPVLDQSVIFAIKQSSFPFPPPGAPVVDRTFLVTYIYR